MQTDKWQHDVVELTEQVNSPSSNSMVPWNSLEGVKILLAKKGSEGWELVSTTPNTDIYGCTRKVVLWFKRPTAGR